MRADGRNLVVPGAVAVVQLVGSVVASRHQPDARALDVVGVALLLLGPIALWWRRSRPELPLAVTVVTLQVYLGLDYPVGPVFLSFVVALVCATLARRRVAVALAVAAFLTGVVVARIVGEIGWPELTGAVAWTLTIVSVAEVARARVESAVQARRVAEEEARRRMGEQRLDIAREVHDVLAHSLSLISVQAGVGLHLFDEQPEQARTALGTVKAASADGLRDLRRTLDLLRDNAATTPTPGLADLDRLLESTRSAGVRITCRQDGGPREVSAPVGLTAYRVVQESLTNASRHSSSADVRVALTWTADALQVAVDDDGPARATGPSEESGHGLDGMRERLAAIGGTLRAGPRPDGGFSVRATLPT